MSNLARDIHDKTNYFQYVDDMCLNFDLILIWFNGTSAHMGHFSAKMILCNIQWWLKSVD